MKNDSIICDSEKENHFADMLIKVIGMIVSMAKGSVKTSGLRKTIMIDPDVATKIHTIQANVIKSAHHTMSFSQVIDTTLKLALKDHDLAEVAKVIIAEARKRK